MPIEFAIVELMSSQSSYGWLLTYFHRQGLWCPHCGAALQERTQVYTNECQCYNHLNRPRNTACYALKEWARDDNGDGMCENTVEGMWTLVCNFLHLFRGVHKKFLPDYLAICEFHINHKRIAPHFIVALVATHL